MPNKRDARDGLQPRVIRNVGRMWIRSGSYPGSQGGALLVRSS